MKLFTALCAVAVFLPSVSLADDFKLSDGREYKGVTVSRVEPDGLVVVTDSGVEKLPFTLLPKDVQQKYHYDAQTAATYANQVATAQHDRLEKNQQELNLLVTRQQSDLVPPSPPDAERKIMPFQGTVRKHLPDGGLIVEKSDPKLKLTHLGERFLFGFPKENSIADGQVIDTFAIETGGQVYGDQNLPVYKYAEPPPQVLPTAVPAPTPTQLQVVEIDPQWNIPKSFSLRNDYQKMEMAPKNQGRRSSCTVFATVGVIEFCMGKKGDLTKLSEQFAAWAADQITENRSKDGGYTPDEIIEGMQAYGICTEELMPYKTGSVGRPTKEALEDAAMRKHLGVTWFRKWQSKSKDGLATDEIRAICGSIAEGSPVSVGCAWPKSAQLDSQLFLLDYHNIGNFNDGNGHFIVLVGYEINRSIEGGGAFIFRQSWGDKWGDSGYAKLSFGYLQKHGVEAYAVRLY